MAGSLLVPADMLAMATPGDERPIGERQSRTLEQPPGSGAVTADTASDEEIVHQNPFLLPDAAAVAAAGRRKRRVRRRVLAALLTRSATAADEIGAAPPSGPRGAPEGNVEQAPQRGKPWAAMGAYARACSHHLRPGSAVIVSALLLSLAAVSVIGIASQTNSSGDRPRRTGIASAASSPVAGAGNDGRACDRRSGGPRASVAHPPGSTRCRSG